MNENERKNLEEMIGKIIDEKFNQLYESMANKAEGTKEGTTEEPLANKDEPAKDQAEDEKEKTPRNRLKKAAIAIGAVGAVAAIGAVAYKIGSHKSNEGIPEYQPAVYPTIPATMAYPEAKTDPCDDYIDSRGFV